VPPTPSSKKHEVDKENVGVSSSKARSLQSPSSSLELDDNNSLATGMASTLTIPASTLSSSNHFKNRTNSGKIELEFDTSSKMIASADMMDVDQDDESFDQDVALQVSIHPGIYCFKKKKKKSYLQKQYRS